MCHDFLVPACHAIIVIVSRYFEQRDLHVGYDDDPEEKSAAIAACQS